MDVFPFTENIALLSYAESPTESSAELKDISFAMLRLKLHMLIKWSAMETIIPQW